LIKWWWYYPTPPEGWMAVTHQSGHVPRSGREIKDERSQRWHAGKLRCGIKL